mgnify:CR=1 FL=1
MKKKKNLSNWRSESVLSEMERLHVLGGEHQIIDDAFPVNDACRTNGKCFHNNACFENGVCERNTVCEGFAHCTDVIGV